MTKLLNQPEIHFAADIGAGRPIIFKFIKLPNGVFPGELQDLHHLISSAFRFFNAQPYTVMTEEMAELIDRIGDFKAIVDIDQYTNALPSQNQIKELFEMRSSTEQMKEELSQVTSSILHYTIDAFKLRRNIISEKEKLNLTNAPLNVQRVVCLKNNDLFFDIALHSQISDDQCLQIAERLNLSNDEELLFIQTFEQAELVFNLLTENITRDKFHQLFKSHKPIYQHQLSNDRHEIERVVRLAKRMIKDERIMKGEL